jgi:hypothetical protein
VVLVRVLQEILASTTQMVTKKRRYFLVNKDQTTVWFELEGSSVAR